MTNTTHIASLSSIPHLSIPSCKGHFRNTRVVIIGGSVGGLAAAASLKAAGFNPKNLTAVERAKSPPSGAGIGLDDASVGILKGLGLLLGKRGETGTVVSVQSMRMTEERILPTCGEVKKEIRLSQPYPYSAVLYSELVKGLESAAEGIDFLRGHKAVEIISEKEGCSQVLVQQVDSHAQKILECDLAIVADGPRSRFRHLFASSKTKEDKEDLRFSGYTAWRGTVPETELSDKVLDNLKEAYPDFGNCLYFIWGPPGKSAVLYDIGKGLVNWLIYDTETCPNGQPKAPPGRTTTTATPSDIQQLHQQAVHEWGDALGALIQSTPDPFQNDIYDIETPLDNFCRSGLCILGDAAHPISPHCAKGSNLAIHDAYVLACAAAKATCIAELLQMYSTSRVEACRTTVMLSRHLGRLRNRMKPLLLNSESNIGVEVPSTTEQLNALVRLADAQTSVTLPFGSSVFEPTWSFIDAQVPAEQRGFCLSNVMPTRPLSIAQVNHFSLETTRVDRLVGFYRDVLGLTVLTTRPNFGFGGAWLQLPGGISLHIIERDPTKPSASAITIGSQKLAVPERFIRRSNHLALTVLDIEAAKATLRDHGITFAVNKVPDTFIEQLFVYDPDGNGVEIGNFGLV